MRQEARVALDKLAGDLSVAGYRTANVAEVISQASATTLQFAADVDDGSPAAPCGAALENAVDGGVERITYTQIAGELLRSVDCWNGAAWSAGYSNQVVAGNLVDPQTLFRYFDRDGIEIVGVASGLSAAQRGQVRAVHLALDLLDLGKNQAVGAVHTNFQIVNQVKLRNLR